MNLWNRLPRSLLRGALCLSAILAGCRATRIAPPADVDVFPPLVLVRAPHAPASPGVMGAATADVERADGYWRRHFRRNIAPRHADLLEAGFGDWRRGLYLAAPRCYTLEDFRAGLALLRQGLRPDLDPQARRAVQEWVVNHEHAEQLFLALECLAAVGHSPEALTAAFAAVRRLTDFRQHAAETLRPPPTAVATTELLLGDLTGTAFAALFADTEPVSRLPLQWRFRAESDGAGADWAATTALELLEWSTIQTDRPWNAQTPELCPAAAELRAHTGVGWYAVVFEVDPEHRAGAWFLNVRGVTSDCRFFVNGQAVGTHDFNPRAPVSVSYRVPIGHALNPATQMQLLVVRVDGRGSTAPGIWQPVWLSREKSAAAAITPGS